MNRNVLCAALAAAALMWAGCEKRHDRQEGADRPGASVDVNTTQRSDGEDAKVKVRVRTPGGDYNVDVNY